MVCPAGTTVCFAPMLTCRDAVARPTFVVVTTPVNALTVSPSGEMPAALVGRDKVMFVEMTAVAAQPRDDGLAEDRRSVRALDISKGTRGCDDAVAAARNEIARDDVQPFVRPNWHPGRTLEHDTQHSPVARGVNREPRDRQQLGGQRATREAVGDDPRELIAGERQNHQAIVEWIHLVNLAVGERARRKIRPQTSAVAKRGIRARNGGE